MPEPSSQLGTINAWLDENIIPYCGLLPASRSGPPGPQIPASARRGTMGDGISSRVRDRLEGAVFGALVGDALALGAHYEYDSEKIWRAYGGQVIGSLDKPGTKNRTSSGRSPTYKRPLIRFVSEFCVYTVLNADQGFHLLLLTIDPFCIEVLHSLKADQGFVSRSRYSGVGRRRPSKLSPNQRRRRSDRLRRQRSVLARGACR